MSVIGTQQSPIRIERATTLQAVFPVNYLKVEYVNADIPGTFDGHNFEFAQANRPRILFKNQPWLAHFIHIHEPSEHLLNQADAADFECHLVHFAQADIDRRGPKVVLGAFLHKTVGAVTPPGIVQLNRAIAPQAQKISRTNPRNIQINPTEFLPNANEQVKWYHYFGSLTGEPYSEDVTWFAMAHEIAVNPNDVDNLLEAAEHEAREVQQLNRRIVLRSFDTR